jgi:aryl-alcohol dehydrogenase-like predicted oxidoreductase
VATPLGFARSGDDRSFGSVAVYADRGPAGLKGSDVKSLQIPFNLLDQRWRSKEIRQALAARPDVVVSARSVFLQGVLFKRCCKLAVSRELRRNAYVRALQHFTKRFERQERRRPVCGILCALKIGFVH